MNEETKTPVVKINLKCHGCHVSSSVTPNQTDLTSGTVVWVCSFCNSENADLLRDSGNKIYIDHPTPAESHLDLKPDTKLRFHCTYCGNVFITNEYILQRDGVIKFTCEGCHMGSLINYAHMEPEDRDINLNLDFSEANRFGFPPSFPINEAPAPSRDQDAPPKRGFGWVFPLAMELAGQQIVKGYESYETLLESGNGRFMDLPPELFDAFIYSIAQREDMRRLITLGRALSKASDLMLKAGYYAINVNDYHDVEEKLSEGIHDLEDAMLAWNKADNYPEDVTRK